MVSSFGGHSKSQVSEFGVPHRLVFGELEMHFGSLKRTVMELATKSTKTLHHTMPVEKPVEMLAIVPKKDRITILARKIYNILIYEA